MEIKFYGNKETNKLYWVYQGKLFGGDEMNMKGIHYFKHCSHQEIIDWDIDVDWVLTDSSIDKGEYLFSRFPDEVEETEALFSYELDKESWHYRLQRKISSIGYTNCSPDTLCEYFWKSVFNLGVLPFLTWLTLTVFGLIPLAAFNIKATSIYDFFWIWTVGGFTIGALGLLFYGFAQILLKIQVYRENKQQDLDIIEYAKRKPKGNLILTTLKAMKKKICPVIKYKD